MQVEHRSSPSPQQAETSAAGEYPLLSSCAARGTFRCYKSRESSRMILCPSKADLKSFTSSPDPMSWLHWWLSAHPHLLQEPHPPTAQAEGSTLPTQPLLSKAFNRRGPGTTGRHQASAPASPQPTGTQGCSHTKLLGCCNTTHPQPKHQRHTSALQ